MNYERELLVELLLEAYESDSTKSLIAVCNRGKLHIRYSVNEIKFNDKIQCFIKPDHVRQLIDADIVNTKRRAIRYLINNLSLRYSALSDLITFDDHVKYLADLSFKKK